DVLDGPDVTDNGALVKPQWCGTDSYPAGGATLAAQDTCDDVHGAPGRHGCSPASGGAIIMIGVDDGCPPVADRQAGRHSGDLLRHRVDVIDPPFIVAREDTHGRAGAEGAGPLLADA